MGARFIEPDLAARMIRTFMRRNSAADATSSGSKSSPGSTKKDSRRERHRHALAGGDRGCPSARNLQTRAVILNCLCVEVILLLRSTLGRASCDSRATNGRRGRDCFRIFAFIPLHSTRHSLMQTKEIRDYRSLSALDRAVAQVGAIRIRARRGVRCAKITARTAGRGTTSRTTGPLEAYAGARMVGGNL